MKIKHKEKNYLINTEKYETVWLTEKEIFAGGHMLQCQNDKGLFMASKKLPKNKWTFSVCKDLGSNGLFSHQEEIAKNFKTINEAKEYIKNI
tara:strand:- start:942 stop:1217 length:276 start_codon:yes stop_codon:yes gene_type:complete